MKGMVEERPWYVIQTRSRFEKKCTNYLIKSGVSAYLPLTKKKNVWSDRIKEVEVPLFPGYLFIQFTENERYQILNTPGIVRFVSFGGKYATVNSKQVEAIKRAISTNFELEVVDTTFELGQEVLITSGPFKDNYAQIIRYNGKGKLLISLDSMGKGIVLEIGNTRVEASNNSVRLKASA